MSDDALDLVLLEAGDGKTVTAYARHGPNVATTRIDASVLKPLREFRERIEKSVSSQLERPSQEELRKFGAELFTCGIDKELRRVYNRLPSGAVSLQLISDSPAVRALPWEYAYEPGQVPGPSRDGRAIVRVVPTTGERPLPTPRSLGAGPLRVLFVAADPALMAPSDWENVLESLRRSFAGRFKDREIANRVELDIVTAANRNELTKRLMTKAYDVFHFVGHGEVANGEGRLILLDPQNGKKGVPLPAPTLASMLAGRGLALAVLGACDTAAGSFAGPFDVMAEALVRAGVPAVVANQFPIPAKTAASFTVALYASLLTSGDIDVAVTEGRVALCAELDTGRPEANLEWGIPVLYRHIRAARIFTP